MSPSLRESRRLESSVLTASTPRRVCIHASSRSTMRAVTRLGHLANALAPGVEAHQRDADGGLVAGRVQRVERQRLDRRPPVGLEGRGRVEESLEFALAQRAQGVAQRPGAVEEVLLGVVAAGVDQVASLGLSRAFQTIGIVTGVNVVCPRRPAGEVAQHVRR